jgi:hypothetical protein
MQWVAGGRPASAAPTDAWSAGFHSITAVDVVCPQASLCLLIAQESSDGPACLSPASALSCDLLNKSVSPCLGTLHGHRRDCRPGHWDESLRSDRCTPRACRTSCASAEGQRDSGASSAVSYNLACHLDLGLQRAHPAAEFGAWV